MEDPKGKARWRQLPRQVVTAGRMIRASAPRAATAAAIVTVTANLGLLLLLLSGRRLIDLLDGGSRAFGELMPVVGVLAVALVVISTCQAADVELRHHLGYLVECEVTSNVVAAASSVPLAEFESPDFQNHLQRALTQAGHRPWEITQAATQLIGAVAGGVVVAVVLFTIDPLLVLGVLLSGIPLTWAATRNSRAMFDAINEASGTYRERQYLQELLTSRHAALEIRAFGSDRYLRERFLARYRRELDLLRLASRLRMRRSLLAALGSTLLVVLVLVGLVASARDGLPLADVAIAVVGIQQLASRMRGLNTSLGGLHEATLFLDDYQDFLVRARSRGGAGSAVPDVSTPGPPALRLGGVTFTYPGAVEPALRGVDLELRPGRVTALVGANGSGKSTVVKLVAGLYVPDRGTVSWSGDWVRGGRVSVMLQEFVRYQLTAHDNVGIGDPDRIDERGVIAHSVGIAGAAGFIERLPDGIDTWLSPQFDGTDLSAGQWQRVALARAVFRSADVVVLDEPTAALDPSSERELLQRSSSWLADKAVLVVSHRFANVIDADEILVLDEGRVVERGSHQQLVDLDGRYADLYRAQVAGLGVTE